jgi:hypothetical protein
MAILLLLSITTGAIFLLTRRDIFNPSTVFGTSACLNAWTFYIIGVHGKYPPSVDTWWHVQYDYRPAAATVMLIYAFQIGIALGVRWLTDRDTSESLADESTLRASQPLDALQQYLSGSIAVAIFAGLLFICVWHFLSIDPDKLLRYQDYLSTRETARLDLGSGVLNAFHSISAHLGCLLVVFPAYYFCRRDRAMFWLSLLPTVYVLMVTASFVSRAVVAQVGLAWLVLNLTPTDYQRWWRMALIVVPLILYGAVLSLRGEEGYAGEYGLLPLFALLIDGRFLLSDSLFTVMFNLFDGGFAIGHAVLHEATLEHTFRYKLHSFFPGPSFIDGFAAFRDLDELRPNPNSPYAAFAEAYLFGPLWLAFYSGAVCFMLWSVTRVWNRYRWGPGVLIGCFSYVIFFYMQTYQIRNSFRLLVAATLLAWIFDWIAQSRATQSQAENTTELAQSDVTGAETR